MSEALFLFNKTDNMAIPWAEAGYVCVCVDLQNDNSVREVGKGRIIRVQADVKEFVKTQNPKDYSFGAAFTPCDHMAVSGARWFKGKGLRKLAESIELFACSAEFMDEINGPYLIENPVSTISTYWRKWDYMFQPWEYGDLWDKPTCLWTGNGFVMPDKLHTERPEGVDRKKIHYASPGPERANLRSETPPGFARAVFQANAIRTDVTIPDAQIALEVCDVIDADYKDGGVW